MKGSAKRRRSAAPIQDSPDSLIPHPIECMSQDIPKPVATAPNIPPIILLPKIAGAGLGTGEFIGGRLGETVDPGVGSWGETPFVGFTLGEATLGGVAGVVGATGLTGVTVCAVFGLASLGAACTGAVPTDRPIPNRLPACAVKDKRISPIKRQLRAQTLFL